jgi:hypothetical protein
MTKKQLSWAKDCRVSSRRPLHWYTEGVPLLLIAAYWYCVCLGQFIKEGWGRGTLQLAVGQHFDSRLLARRPV